MLELALNDDQRHALARHLDRVRVPELVRREAPPHARPPARRVAAPSGRRRPPMGARAWRRYDAEQRSDRRLDPRLEPGLKLLPGPVVHADLAAAAALAAPDKQRPAPRIQVGLGERERLVDAQPGAPQHDDQAAQPAAVDAVAGAA
jgi:hypothetical protein